MFVDASAIVAIMLGEDQSDALSAKLSEATNLVTSPLAVFEVVSALARYKKQSIESLIGDVSEFLEVADIEIMPISSETGYAAIRASAVYGKGSGHPARLNLGDCFAYAMAKRRGVPLLYKGDDFARTDLA